MSRVGTITSSLGSAASSKASSLNSIEWGFASGDEEKRARRDRLDGGEGVEVHEGGVRGERRLRRRDIRLAGRGERAPGRAVEVVKLALDRMRVGRQRRRACPR